MDWVRDHMPLCPECGKAMDYAGTGSSVPWIDVHTYICSNDDCSISEVNVHEQLG